jgi:drug/metabolite transporter (DMT)-like permease
VTRRGWLLFLALSVIWGIPYLLIKVAVRELTPASLVFLRTAPVGIAQLPTVMPSPAVIGSVVVLGVACTAMAFLLFFRLIAEVGPVRATVITYVNPAIALLAGVTLLGEPFSPGTAAGFVLIIAGSWLATGPSRSSPVARGADAAGPDPAEHVRSVGSTG